MSNKFKFTKNILQIVKKDKKTQKWLKNFDINKIEQKNLLYQYINDNNLKNKILKSSELLEKKYFSKTKTKNDNTKKKINIDFHGCENYIEEIMYYEKNLK